jgi:hypothetical protein
MSEVLQQYRPGSKVRVIQQVPRQDRGGGTLATEVVGTVVRAEQMKTGSWYAHGKNDRLWLDRLVLKKADGEVVFLNLDQYTKVDFVD